MTLDEMEVEAYRILNTRSPREIGARSVLWLAAVYLAALLCVVSVVVTFGSVAGQLSLWAMPFGLSLGLFASMLGARSFTRRAIYEMAMDEHRWWSRRQEGRR